MHICVQRFLGVVVPQDVHLLGAQEIGLAVDLLDLVGLQQSRYATGQLFGDGVLVGNHLGEVHPDAVRLHADLRALVLDLGHQLCAVQQALGRDAANVQAGAAQVLPLHQGHPGAQLGDPDRGNIAAGTASNNRNFHGTFPSMIKPKSSLDARYNTLRMQPTSRSSRT